MEPLLKQLRELQTRFASLSTTVRYLTLGGAGALVVGLMVWLASRGGVTYEYAFTNLTPEDSSEAAGVLKGAGIVFHTEAGGSALAVPAGRVHEVRLMLAAAGLPRGGGVGFEIFDRGDLGVSEFTQKVNLRRAIEGELARTISRLGAVRSARVHITLPEKGLYRNEDRKAAAAVVLNLQPGRVVNERELAGVRHLVSAAVEGLSPESVAVMDGRGAVLAGDRAQGEKLATAQHELETTMEQRILELLEPVVGRGGVVAKVTATLDSREVDSSAETYDPEGSAIRSERRSNELTTNDAAGPAVAGAASATGAGSGGRNQSSREDAQKNYEVSKTVTHTVSRTPRLTRLSAALLISDPEGKPRSEAELKRLGDLAKHAIGFDAQRGDQLDVSSAPFVHDAEAQPVVVPVWKRTELLPYAAGGLIALAVIVMAMRGRRRYTAADLAMIKPGSKVAELEADLRRNGVAAVDTDSATLSRTLASQTRARELVDADPGRAAHLLRAWIAMDSETGDRGGG